MGYARFGVSPQTNTCVELREMREKNEVDVNKTIKEISGAKVKEKERCERKGKENIIG